MKESHTNGKSSMDLVTVNPDMGAWELMQRQCKAFMESGFLPKHVTSMAQALTIAWKGRELGVPPLQSFSSITVINGKPCLSAELMLALIYQRVKGAKVTFKTAPEQQNKECTVVMQRPDGDPQVFRFTIDDAKAAGLTGGAWQKYPAAMLRARAVSAGARAVFPDCIMGCYTPEEMGAETIEGEIVHPKDENKIYHSSKPLPSPESFPPPPGQEYKGNPGWDRRLATEKQIKMLYAVAHKVDMNAGELLDVAHEMFGVDELSQLTQGQVQSIVKELGGASHPVGSDKDIAQAAEEGTV